jgi:hypothetical protein
MSEMIINDDNPDRDQRKRIDINVEFILSLSFMYNERLKETATFILERQRIGDSLSYDLDITETNDKQIEYNSSFLSN